MQVSSPFNHPIFNNPPTNLARPATFGVITATAFNLSASLMVFDIVAVCVHWLGPRNQDHSGGSGETLKYSRYASKRRG